MRSYLQKVKIEVEILITERNFNLKVRIEKADIK